MNSLYLPEAKSDAHSLNKVLPRTRGSDCHDAPKISGEGLYFKEHLHDISEEDLTSKNQIGGGDFTSLVVYYECIYWC